MPAPKDPRAAPIRALERAIAKAATLLEDSPDPVHVAAIQSAIAALRDLERDLAIGLGKNLGAAQGELPDGRLFTLKRAQDRKEWDHEEWKRDARRAIVAKTEVVPAINPDTGEVIDLAPILFRVIAEAQEVHGSTAPRSTSLKALGLYAGDYCTSSPGGWTFRATPKPTTIQEN